MKPTEKGPWCATSKVSATCVQAQIQDFKEVFSMTDQNRDSYTDKEDLRDRLEATGFIQEDHLQELLTTMGDHFKDKLVDKLYREAPVNKKRTCNYIKFTCILKH
ncbi:myosin regulatory light chain 2, smooth muscle minor isoform-like [Ochotona princeps]|uniref:myosin regulatory light chain 2, smooth muscle minor isoform-like n=1 Tax=Ochotona princeps TaxID=9978 RepID=UPI0027147F32|nr:myosin regulatory light chain 2, smooth muscle minor isoform-like [Ochotona princeps]